MSRRPYLALLAISLCAGLAPGQGALQGTLRQAAEKAGLDIGFAATSFQLTGGFGETAGTHFNLVVSENELRFLPAHPSRDRFNFSGGDKLYEWGKANGARLRGHTFVWPTQSGWVAGAPATREGRLEVLKTHIDCQRAKRLRPCNGPRALHGGRADDLRSALTRLCLRGYAPHPGHALCAWSLTRWGAIS